MGNLDSYLKVQLEDNRKFADIVNLALYDGEPRISPDQLSPMDPSEITLYLGDDEKASSEQKVRDSLRLVSGKESPNARYLICGVENQASIDYAMPARVLLYDALCYERQRRALMREAWQGRKNSQSSGEFLGGIKKGTLFLPVITIVMYYGEAPWDGPTSLREMLAISEPEIAKWIPDYPMRLISVHTMSLEALDRLSSDIRLLLGAVRYSSDKVALAEFFDKNRTKFKHSDLELANTILVALGRKEILLESQEGGAGDMLCKALADLREEGVVEGREAGRAEGVANTIVLDCQEDGKTFEFAVEKIARRLGIIPSEATKLAKQFWVTP